MAADLKGPIAYGENGLYLEVWRFAPGTVGDTLTVVPSRLSDIRSAWVAGNFGHDLTTAAETNVTFTQGTGVNTSTFYDIHVLGRRPTT